MYTKVLFVGFTADSAFYCSILVLTSQSYGILGLGCGVYSNVDTR